MTDAKGYYSEEQDDLDRQSYYGQHLQIEDFTLNDLSHLLRETHISWLQYQPSTYLYPEVDLHPDGQLKSIYSNQQFTAEELIAADRQIDLERSQQIEEWVKLLKLPGKIAYERLLEEVEALLPYNCEHVICQSWFNKAVPMRGDLHHLFTCENKCNSFRNNCPYTDFPLYQPGRPSVDDKEKSACGFVTDGLFEPEHNKGIVARAVLYFKVRYPGVISIYGQEEIRMLKRWSDEETVNLYEKHRNQRIFTLQGNRNPFIDFPLLAGLLLTE